MGGLQGLGLLDNDCKGSCHCPWKKNPRRCRKWSEELQDRKYTHSAEISTILFYNFTLRFTENANHHYHNQSNL